MLPFYHSIGKKSSPSSLKRVGLVEHYYITYSAGMVDSFLDFGVVQSFNWKMSHWRSLRLVTSAEEGGGTKRGPD